MAASSGEPQAREIPVPSNCVEGRESYLTLSLEWQEKARLMVMPHAPHWRLFRGKGYFFWGGARVIFDKLERDSEAWK